MQKCLFSAPDGPAGPGTREIHLVPPPASSAPAIPAVSASTESSVASVSASANAANAGEATAMKGTEVAGAPVSTGSTAPALVWPPSDEDLDDWHVIPLNRPNADAPAGATANGGAAAPGAGKTGKTDAPGTNGASPRKPLPAWLANHRATKSGGGSTTGTIGAPTLNLAPRAMPAAPSGSPIRAVPPSPLEDTARLPSETTTAISAIRRPQAQASAESTGLGLAPAAQPLVARPVAAFPAERRRPVAVARPAPSRWNGVARRTAIVVLALLAAGQAAYIGARLLVTPDATSTSVLTVDSVPDGADVFIDGERRGVTPFKVELAAGSHSLQLRKNGRTRTIPLVLAAGVQASQYVELDSASAPAGGAAGSSAGLSSGSGSSSAPPSAPSAAAPRPAAAAPSAASPVPADGIAAPAAADATTPPPGSSRGWVVIESGLNLRVLRNGELLGSSEEGRLALSAGRHELELVNDAVGYRAVMTVQVPPGRAVPVPVELPQSVLNITSTPSARVWVDGREIGSTPIAQLALPVGQHSVRFEHPQYGERSMTVLVRVGVTAQASVDFTR